jgi:ABC-2 type transport system permease protein
MILGLLISTLLILSIGLFLFFIEDSGPFYWVYSKLILVMGTLFPIEYFPSIVQKILVYTSVYVVNYGPAKLFVDFNIYKGIGIIIAQIIYVIIAYLICNFIYRKGVRRINVNGG